MSGADNYGLRPLWIEMLAIFDEFVKICERHGLRYYAYAGTALGAVRHKGFIPWDDDMDLAMPRPDYEAFAAIANEELPSCFRFVNWKNTGEFSLLFGKIQLADRDKVERIERNMGKTLSNGIFIDIFPLDGYPSKWWTFYIKTRDFGLSLLERYHLTSFAKLTFRGKIAWCAGAVVSIFVPWIRRRKQFLSIHENSLLKFRFGETKMIGDVGYFHDVFRHPCYKRDVWGQPVPHEFEDRSIMLPTDVDAHLKAHFGNYMELPPESARHPSHQLSYHHSWWLGPTIVDKI